MLMDVGSLEGGTLSPIIMEVETGGIWKVTAIGRTYFSPCLWEEGYWVTRIKYWLGGFKDYWFFILPLFYLLRDMTRIWWAHIFWNWRLKHQIGIQFPRHIVPNRLKIDRSKFLQLDLLYTVHWLVLPWFVWCRKTAWTSMSRSKGDTGSKGFMKNSTVVSCCAFPMEKGSIFVRTYIIFWRNQFWKLWNKWFKWPSWL